MIAPTPVISAWSAVSAFGVGCDPFALGVQSKSLSPCRIDPDRHPAPVDEAFLVPMDHPSELLGSKGTRSMDRATALAVAAVGQLLDGPSQEVSENTAIVLGTSTGSLSSIMSFTRDALTQDKPYLVDPARFPNTVMNCAASRAAIWRRLRGPNITVAGGRAAALLALNHARRLLQCGHTDSVVCGAVEEFSSERAWLAWRTRDDAGKTMLLGEGSAVLLLQVGGATRSPALAEVLAVETGLATTAGDVHAALTGCLDRARTRSGLNWDALWAVAPSSPPGERGRQERRALDDAFGGRKVLELSCAEMLGDTYSASGAFQIAGLLAIALRDPQAAGRLALVTSVDCDGVVAITALRIVGRAREA